jgi:hypothetical protein
MDSRERTRQQLDPAGTTGLRPYTSALVIGAFAYALLSTVLSAGEIVDVPLAVAAMVALGAAVVLVVVGTSPYRGPFGQGTHFIIEALVVGSIALSAASVWGSDQFVRDDWGPIAAGLFLLSIGPYRPAREVVFCGVMIALFVGLLVLLEAPSFVTPGPPVAFVLTAITPILILCFGGAAYSLGAVEAIERWHRRAGEAADGAMSELRGTIARSVQQDRVTILGRDVLPFLTEVLANDRVTDADRGRAREIAVAIRNVMVAEANRSWLENFIDQAGLEAVVVVDDPAALASAMTVEQRTALRTMLVALVGSPGEEPDRLSIRLARDGDLVRTIVAAGFSAGEVIARTAFAPYFALVRSAFESFEADFGQTSLRLRFWYEQR